MSALRDQTEPVGILRELARSTWAKANDGAECPPALAALTPADLAAWLPECPESAGAEAIGRDEALGFLAGDVAGYVTGGRAPGPSLGMDLPALFAIAAPGRGAGAAKVEHCVRYVHRRWLAYHAGALRMESTDDNLLRWTAPPVGGWPAVAHPLAPLVDAWQRWQETMPTERPPFVLGTRGSLARLGNLGADDATLPDFPQADAPPAQDGQLWLLPEFSGDAVRGCTSWLLWLFDRSGGESMAAGRGAPWDLRLFASALLHLAVADRDGQWHTIRLAASPEHAERIYDATGKKPPNVEDWLHPNGWANKRRDWHKLPEALDRMLRLAYVPVPGIGRVAMLFPSVIPSAPTDPLVEFTIRCPRVAANGDRLNWPRMVEYGADSARMLRAYLAVVPWLGRSAHHGHPITRTIAAPVRGPDGKPARRKGGDIIRSATERIDNPAAHLAGPPLSEADLTRMIGFDPTDRYRRRDCRDAFARMEADGVIERARDGRRWLLFGGPNW